MDRVTTHVERLLWTKTLERRAYRVKLYVCKALSVLEEAEPVVAEKAAPEADSGDELEDKKSEA